MKLEFKKYLDEKNKFDTTEVTFTSYGVTLPEILADFQDFLKGCGFIFNGDLEIVNDSLTQEIDND